jgi:hypothetical protein
MSRGSKIRRKHLDAATRARSGRSNHGSNQKALLNPTVIAVDSSGDGAEISDDEVCSWPGGVNNHLQVESDLLEENWVDLSRSAVMEPVGSFGEELDEGNENDGQSSDEDDEDLCDQEGEELRNSLEESIIQEARANLNAYENLTRRISNVEWTKAEAHRGLGYNGNSKRSKRRARQKVANDKKAQTGHVLIIHYSV